MKKAFTMLELIFVIVVIGILAATMMPNMQSGKAHEAAIQLVSHIRYTQHLAMIDDKYEKNNVWHKGLWQIVFTGATTEPRYSVFSDAPGYTGSADAGEIATDPSNRSKLLSGGSSSLIGPDPKITQKLNLNKSYGITKVVMTNKDGSTNGCKTHTRISFDHLGRPIAGPLDSEHGVVRDEPYKNIRLLNKTCVITLTHPSDGNVTIEIEPETGYAHIVQS